MYSKKKKRSKKTDEESFGNVETNENTCFMESYCSEIDSFKQSSTFPVEHIYENLKYCEQNLCKQYLLERFFRSGYFRTDVIYENVSETCRGCADFLEKGASFCSKCCETSINSGLNQQNCSYENTNENEYYNIYENICDHCGDLYNPNKYRCENENTKEICLLNNNIKETEPKLFFKLDKTNSILKWFRTSRRFLRTESRHSRKKSYLSNNRHLEIVHHIEGFDNVFKTQETFDLQKISELKRLHHVNFINNHFNNSCLKSNEIFYKSNYLQNPQNKFTNLADIETIFRLPLCLNDSICNWINNLRYSVSDYNDFSDVNYSKSVPGKISNKCSPVLIKSECVRPTKPEEVVNYSPVMKKAKHPSGGHIDILATEFDFSLRQLQKQQTILLPQAEQTAHILSYNNVNFELKNQNQKKQKQEKQKASERRSQQAKQTKFHSLGAWREDQLKNYNHKTAAIAFTLNCSFNNNILYEEKMKLGAATMTTSETSSSLFSDDDLRELSKSKNIKPKQSENPLRNNNFKNSTELQSLDVGKPLSGNQVLSRKLTKLQIVVDVLTGGRSENCKRDSYFFDNDFFLHVFYSYFESLCDFRFNGNNQIENIVVRDTFNQIETENNKKVNNSFQYKLNENKKKSVLLLNLKFLTNFLLIISSTTNVYELLSNLSAYFLNCDNISSVKKNLLKIANSQFLSSSLQSTVILFCESTLYLFFKLIIENKKHNLKYKETVWKKYVFTFQNSVTSTKDFNLFNQTIECKNPKFLQFISFIIENPLKVTQHNSRNAVKASSIKTKLNKETHYETNSLLFQEKKKLEACSKMLGTNKKNTTENITMPTPKSTSVTQKCNTNSNNNNNKLKNCRFNCDEIYQPIWKYKTVGEVSERYETDLDYYEIGDAKTTSLSNVLVTNDDSSSSLHDIEDHGEWETDDEFMFTAIDESLHTKRHSADCSSANFTIHSNNNCKTEIGSLCSESFSDSLQNFNHYRNICLIFSLSEPKLRAIIYDYERNNLIKYFEKMAASKAAWAITDFNSKDVIANNNKCDKFLKQCSSVAPLRLPTTSSVLQQLKKIDTDNYKTKYYRPAPPPPVSPVLICPSAALAAPSTIPTRTFSMALNPIEEWKSLLLSVNYLEDEEDMLISENGIIGAQFVKENNEDQLLNQQSSLQKYKSVSSDNLLELPCDEDKKSITEKVRNKFHKGVLKLNSRSPRGDKKSRYVNQRKEIASLCLDESSFPIFGVSLDQLELNQTTYPNVPRFVVDCIELIEHTDSIQQDGLYRASGNKVAIDDLKKKLSIFYDKNLLVTDDIHTVTSLLKQFFREISKPLIPQDIYDSLGRNLVDPLTIENIGVCFDEMPEPNKSTLKFLIKHLVNVAANSEFNRMPASNLAIVWGPCILSANKIEFDIGRMNTLAKVLIENFETIFVNKTNERLVS